MHHLLPLARLIEHLGDKGFLSADEVAEFQFQCRRLTFMNFSETVIREALFCWKGPEVHAAIRQFDETDGERHRMSSLTLKKSELLNAVRPLLNGEAPDVESAFSKLADAQTLTFIQALGYIPHHHPKAIDAIVATYLGRARETRYAIS